MAVPSLAHVATRRRADAPLSFGAVTCRCELSSASDNVYAVARAIYNTLHTLYTKYELNDVINGE